MNTTTEQDPDVASTAAVKFSRLPARGILLGLAGLQLAALGAAIVLVVGSLYAAGAVGLLGTAPLSVMAIAAATIPLGGRKAIEWAPTVLAWQWRKQRDHTTHRRPATPATPGLLRLPAPAGPLRLVTDAGTGAAMIHDPHAMTLTATFEIGYDGFPLQDTLVQQRRTTGWERALSACCRTGRIARIQVAQRSIPDAGAGLDAWWNTHGPDTDPDAGTATWLARTYRNLIDRAGPTAERHVTTISVALDLRAAARRIRATGGGLDGAATVLRHDIDTLTQALTAGDLHPGPHYTREELTTAIRTAYGPTQASTGNQLDMADGGHPDNAGPAAFEEFWDHLRVDAAFHAVLWISQWPQTRVHAGFLGPLLLHAGGQRAFSLIYEPVRTDRAIRDIRKAKTEHLADATQRARIGQIQDARDVAEFRDVGRQEAELAAGHGLLRYTGLITVTAASRDELEAAIAEAEQDALQAGCETRRLAGDQARAFTTAALPLCHGS